MKFYKRKIQVILKLGRLTKIIIHHHNFLLKFIGSAIAAIILHYTDEENCHLKI